MASRRLGPCGLTFAVFMLLSACGTNSQPKESIKVKNLADEKEDAAPKDKGASSPNPAVGIGPTDPNVNTGKSTTPFPAVSFSIDGAPTASSDGNQFKLTVQADASISHYAYKLTTDDGCNKTGGYTVYEVKAPIEISVERFPMGPVYLCAIAYHFPTQQWQDINKALVYKWRKIPFKRDFDSYLTIVDANCNNTVVNVASKLSIDGGQGTYTYQRPTIPNCRTDTTPFTDLISKVVVTESTLEGSWHQGTQVTGWFKLTFTNPERTAFKGTWGLGVPGVKVEGNWNSVGL